MSCCKLDVALRVFEHKFVLWLISSRNFYLNWRYTNFDGLFRGCIQSGKYHKRCLANLGLMKGLRISDFFYACLCRCDSRVAVERLFDFTRALKSAPGEYCDDPLKMMKSLDHFLRNNPPERVSSFAPALEYWKSVAPGDFDKNCPENWKRALIN